MARFDIGPLAGQDRYGALVTGLSPDAIDEPEIRQVLHDLWIDRGLIVFRGIGGGIDTQIRLSEIYGEPEVHPMMAGTDIKTEHRALAPIEFDRDAGITEFLLFKCNELPLDDAGLEDALGEASRKYVDLAATL